MVVEVVIAFMPKPVTDPNDPRFDPMQFKLANYRDISNAVPVLAQMFPIGTDRKYVDKILVENAGARAVEKFSGTVTYYFDRPFRVHSLIIRDLSGRCEGDWVYELSYDHADKVEKRRVPCW